jgi:uncharacterized protein YdeI (YjbR/CyaY-like superfamily)
MPRDSVINPVFFPAPAALRDWFADHHATATELIVGYHRVGSGIPSVTWPESVDEALAVGWIDGIRRSLDDQRYTIRFTPRKRGSIWSAVNVKRAEALIASGRMQPAGLRAFEARKDHRSGIYAYEQRETPLSARYERAIRRNKAAWAFFRTQPPSYIRSISWHVMSAKSERTREARLQKWIAHWAKGISGREKWQRRRPAKRR